MERDEEIKKEKQEQDKQDASIKPDPETLHTTDPQEKMKGPVSSLVQDAKDIIDEQDEEEKESNAH